MRRRIFAHRTPRRVLSATTFFPQITKVQLRARRLRPLRRCRWFLRRGARSPGSCASFELRQRPSPRARLPATGWPRCHFVNDCFGQISYLCFRERGVMCIGWSVALANRLFHSILLSLQCCDKLFRVGGTGRLGCLTHSSTFLCLQSWLAPLCMSHEVIGWSAHPTWYGALQSLTSSS